MRNDLLSPGSPNGHSPVLNLSKSAGGGSASEREGSRGGGDRSPIDGDHSGSEGDGPEDPVGPPTPHSNPEDDEEENLSDVEDDDEKEQGTLRSRTQTRRSCT